MPDHIPFSTSLEGNELVDCVQLQPKISAIYDAATERMKTLGTGLTFSATVSKGYRGGGFNTQIFSDVLQRKMMLGMMELLGVHLDGQGDLSTDGLTYKPESCLNYEVGGKYRMRSAGHILESSLTAYRIDCRNQQMTVFPYEKGTGRIMTNAGKSRSIGVEIETCWIWKGISLTISGSLMDTRFIEYDDGRNDWSGKRIPYSPNGTLNLRAGYKLALNGRYLRSVSLNADLNHYGRTNWNEFRGCLAVAIFIDRSRHPPLNSEGGVLAQRAEPYRGGIFSVLLQVCRQLVLSDGEASQTDDRNVNKSLISSIL